MARFKNVVGIALLLIGIIFCFSPEIRTWYLERKTEESVREFEEKYKNGSARGETAKKDTSATGKMPDVTKEEDPLYQECLTYNESIYEAGQTGFADAWGYAQPALSLDQLEGEIFGYVEIPSMETKLSLYLGASDQNLEKGAAIMGQTSIPIGGENTNCVIAGHRGYYGSPYLREIERISVGDLVYVTNPWETLVYQAVEIDIISPSDLDAIRIREGKDMITLLTCHPYAANTVAKNRYVVYCERYDDTKGVMEAGAVRQEKKGQIISSQGEVYDASADEIRSEEWFRKAAALLLVVLTLVTVFRLINDKKDCECRQGI